MSLEVGNHPDHPPVVGGGNSLLLSGVLHLGVMVLELPKEPPDPSERGWDLWKVRRPRWGVLLGGEFTPAQEFLMFHSFSLHRAIPTPLVCPCGQGWSLAHIPVTTLSSYSRVFSPFTAFLVFGT